MQYRYSTFLNSTDIIFSNSKQQTANSKQQTANSKQQTAILETIDRADVRCSMTASADKMNALGIAAK